MDKQIKYLVGLLILVLIAAFFLSLLGELPQYFKDDIIAFLEEEFSGDISFSSVSLWPLNRIRLKSFSYQDQNGNSFAVKQLNLDYNLNLSDFNNLIEFKFIEAESAELLLKEDLFADFGAELEADADQDSQKGQDLTKKESAFTISDFELPQFISNIKVNLINSKLELKGENLDLKLNNFNLGLNAETKNSYQLNLATAVEINKLDAFELKLNDFKTESLEIEFSRDNSEADLYLAAKELKVKPFLRFLEKKEYNFNNFKVDLNSLQGEFSAKTEVKFRDSKLLNYDSEFDLSGLKLETVYQRAELREALTLNFDNFSLAVSGPKLEAAVVKNQLSIADNRLEVDFKLSQKAKDFKYQAKIKALDFNYDYQILNPYLKSAKFDFELNLIGENTELKKADAKLKAASFSTKFGDFVQSELKVKLLDDEIFLEDALLQLKNKSKLSLKANYNLADHKYQLQAEAEEFLISKKIISLLEEYELGQKRLKLIRKLEADKLNFTVKAAGYKRADRTFSAAGDFSLDYNLKDQANGLELEGDFWLADQVLYLESLNLVSDFVYLDLMGEIDFAAQEFDLRYAAKNFEAAVLNELYNLDIGILEKINPEFKYLEGKIADSFANPTLSFDLQLSELNYQDYFLEDIMIKAVYQNDNLRFREIKAAVNQGIFKAVGEIENLSDEFLLDFNLKSENLYFQDLAAVSNGKLPFSGEMQLDLDLKGSLADYQLDFNFNSDNLVFNYQGREFEISNLNTQLIKEGQQFKVNNFSFEHRNLAFKAAGIYDLESGFDLSYNLKGIEPRNYLLAYPKIANDFSGGITIEGEIKGLLDDLKAAIRAESEALNYDGFEIKIKANNSQFSLKEQKLFVNEFNFSFAGGEYQLKGELFDFSDKLKSNFTLSLLEVPTAEILNKYLGFDPFKDQIILNGDLKAESEGSDYKLDLDLAAETASDQKNILNLSGEVGREFFLDFEGEKIPIEFIDDQYGFNLKIRSELDLNGSLRGSFSSPILNLEHKFYNLKINNTALESFAGNFLLERGRRISLSEKISFIKGGELEIGGSYSLIDDELNLNSKLQALPLEFILSFFGSKLSSDAVVNGNFRAEGELRSPDLSGLLNVDGNYLDLGLWNNIKDFSAALELKDEQALVKKLNGKFGDGSFKLGGHFKLFEPEEFWNLNLSAQDLYFDYGSLSGNFEPELEFTGPLMAPLLKGEIELYDFLIGIPFNWPSGEKKAAADAFIPRIDLNLIPKENVRVKNPNMDVLVEEGDLDLNFNHRRQNTLMMEGELSSQSGRFNYYNSRFTLNNADIVFTPVDEDDIPNLQVNATTYAAGREINVNLSGPANSMNISFSSSPEMTEEEILNLLSSRGALGSAIIGGQDIGVQQIILQELIRIANGFLQEDLISDLESDFRTALSLDRIEIDALQYGLNREFAIYLGKNLNNRFYLEYAAFFGEEARENEISFQYKLTEITNLKGSYVGDGEYQITIETEIEF